VVNQAVRDEMVVLDYLSLFVARVFGDHALPTEESPLEKTIELLALVRGRMDDCSQILVGEVAEQEHRPDYAAEFAECQSRSQ